MTDDTYKVGYGKPPLESQYKKGQSGNPKGRKPKSKSFKELFDQHLDEKLTITVKGREKRISRRDAVIMKIISDALQGKPRQLDILMRHLRENPKPEPFGVKGYDAEIWKEAAASIELLDDDQKSEND